MTENKKPKVFIVEDDDAASKSAETALSGAGWDVIREPVPTEALRRLEQEGAFGVTLFISGFSVGDTDGISLLGSVLDISPHTQRMLWVPHDRPDALIEAVNTASIHACMTYPVDPGELPEQAGACLEQFRKDLKQSQFRALISRHNKKMFQVAKNLKKKDQTDRLLLDEKQSKRSRLEFNLRQLERNEEEESSISLADLVAGREIEAAPDTFGQLFMTVAGQVKELATLLAVSRDLEWTPRSMDDILREAPDGFVHPELLDSLVKTAYLSVLELPETSEDTSPESEGPDAEDAGFSEEEAIEKYLELTIEEDGRGAWLKKKNNFSATSFATLDAVLGFLRDHSVYFGIVDDEAIEEWIKKGGKQDEPFAVALAQQPVESRDGSVTYHFTTEYTNPGELREDGSIDFRERGEVPFVKKGTLLAEKQAPVEGKQGVNVMGEEIFCEEPLDPAFVSGHGTELSEDGLSMFAADDGRPHLDPLGEITVNPEFMVNGDVDFKTGNIDFKGNIVVKGTIKQGFHVTGVNLTANEVEGATISLTGDLEVASGITDANIKTVGNIHAKFIHNSTIMGFGNFYVLKEVIDSKILLSGSCQLQTGHIIASTISAKQGIHAGKIGTPSSTPALLKVGREKHIVELLRKNKKRLASSLETIEDLREEIKAWKDEDKILEALAAEMAKIQEGHQDQIRTLKKNYLELKDDVAPEELVQLTRNLKKCLALTKQSAEELQDLFARQDRFRQKIRKARKEIDQCEKENIKLVDEKKYLVEYAGSREPDPSVSVYRSAIQGTRIQGPFSEMVLDEDKGPSLIEEIHSKKGDRSYYEMCIRPLL